MIFFCEQIFQSKRIPEMIEVKIKNTFRNVIRVNY